MNSIPLYAFGLFGIGVTLAVYFLVRRKPKASEELEKERRCYWTR